MPNECLMLEDETKDQERNKMRMNKKETKFKAYGFRNFKFIHNTDMPIDKWKVLANDYGEKERKTDSFGIVQGYIVQ